MKSCLEFAENGKQSVRNVSRLEAESRRDIFLAHFKRWMCAKGTQPANGGKTNAACMLSKKANCVLDGP